MVDEPVIPAIEPVVAPVEVSPVTPQVVAPVEVALAPQPILDPTPVPPTAVVEAPKAPEAAPATLLAAEPAKAPEVAPVAPVEGSTQALPNTEGDLSAEPAPSPTYDPFVFPEGVTLEADKAGEFTKILAEIELGKADHALTQQAGQKLIDFHINEVKRTIDKVNEFNQTTWNNQVNSWKEEFLSDSTYGGNRFQTTVDSALEFIRTHGGSEDEQKELRTILDQSGLGNHKAVIRTFAKAMTAMKEGQPLLAQKPPSAPKSKVTTMYGNS